MGGWVCGWVVDLASSLVAPPWGFALVMAYKHLPAHDSDVACVLDLEVERHIEVSPRSRIFGLSRTLCAHAEIVKVRI